MQYWNIFVPWKEFKILDHLPYTFDELVFQYVLEDLPELVELFLAGNPFCDPDGPMPHYHSAIQTIVPELEIIDGVSTWLWVTYAVKFVVMLLSKNYTPPLSVRVCTVHLCPPTRRVGGNIVFGSDHVSVSVDLFSRSQQHFEMFKIWFFCIIFWTEDGFLTKLA